MRIGLIGPQGLPDSRVSGETNLVLARLVARLQKVGHDVLLCAPGDSTRAADEAPLDLYVTLACDPDGVLTTASVSRDDATILLQAGSLPSLCDRRVIPPISSSLRISRLELLGLGTGRESTTRGVRFGNVEASAVESADHETGSAGSERTSRGRTDEPADSHAPIEQGAGAGQRFPDDRAGATVSPHRRLPQGRRPRPNADGRLPSPREDHALRPRAHPRARGSRPRRGGARRVRGVWQRPGAHERRLPPTRAHDSGVHPFLHRGRVTRVGRHGARRPWVCKEALYRQGKLRPRRQQHSRVLHPRRNQVPRPHSRRQARTRPRDPPGPNRPYDFLGLRVDDP